MHADRTDTGVGAWVLGFGVVALGAVALAWGGFDPGQQAPRTLPDRTILGDAADVFMLVAGAGMIWRRTRIWAAGALAVYYGLIVVLLMGGRVILANAGVYGAYSGAAEQLALAAGALIVSAQASAAQPVLSRRLVRASRAGFGVCLILFGGAHFVYLNLTTPLVPKWLPPSAVFWAYVTGAAQVAAGLAILVNIRARLAAILLTAMYVVFGLLVHLRLVIGQPADHGIWAENALNLALVGAAWVVADSLGGERPSFRR